ncbi:hypothetical protein ON010_g9113 [Phytophthora cinnamomi]|nr:hypothetical protein ON010_g9113 [Phytophthora cinnamomi]
MKTTPTGGGEQRVIRGRVTQEHSGPTVAAIELLSTLKPYTVQDSPSVDEKRKEVPVSPTVQAQRRLAAHDRAMRAANMQHRREVLALRKLQTVYRRCFKGTKNKMSLRPKTSRYQTSGMAPRINKLIGSGGSSKNQFLWLQVTPRGNTGM